MTTVVELRCPTGPKRLLSKLRIAGEQPRIIPGDNLIELSCDDCKRSLRKTSPNVVRVLHRYDLTGALVESLVER